MSTESAVTVLPQPDLADHAQRLAAPDREVDAVDRLHHAVVGREMRLEAADLEQRLGHYITLARIERVAQAVADEVDRRARSRKIAAPGNSAQCGAMSR